MTLQPPAQARFRDPAGAEDADGAEINERLLASGVPAASGTQLLLLQELAQSYRHLGVLGALPLPPLPASCADARICWKRVPSAQPPPGAGRFDPASTKGCIYLPWVGPNYRPGGTCTVGMNLRYAGGDWEFGVEHRIARDSDHGQEVSLRAGRRAHGSPWATSTMRDVVAVQQSLLGREPVDERRPNALADAVLSSARIQAVKCSPVGGRSTPTPEMNERCPPKFLRAELRVLRPRVLLAYGRPVLEALGNLAKIDPLETGRRFRRARLRFDDMEVTVFFMTHPAHGGWHVAHRELLASLQATPVQGSGERA